MDLTSAHVLDSWQGVGIVRLRSRDHTRVCEIEAMGGGNSSAGCNPVGSRTSHANGIVTVGALSGGRFYASASVTKGAEVVVEIDGEPVRRLTATAGRVAFTGRRAAAGTLVVIRTVAGRILVREVVDLPPGDVAETR